MMFSVYDYKRQVFDYFEAPGVPPATGAFRGPRGSKGAPECLAVVLPAGATAKGSGALPKGTIATTSSALGALLGEGFEEWAKYLVAGAVGAWAAKKWWRG